MTDKEFWQSVYVELRRAGVLHEAAVNDAHEAVKGSRCAGEKLATLGVNRPITIGGGLLGVIPCSQQVVPEVSLTPHYQTGRATGKTVVPDVPAGQYFNNPGNAADKNGDPIKSPNQYKEPMAPDYFNGDEW